MSLVIKKDPSWFLEIQVDLSGIMKYENLIPELTQVDIMSGPMYMRDFIAAYEKMAQLVMRVDRMYNEAVLNRKHEEAKAILERAPKYFEANGTLGGGIKDSSSLRETYLNLDQEYVEAKDKENALKAMLSYMQNKLEAFKMAHDDAKKIYDKLATGPFGKTGYEGMKS